VITNNLKRIKDLEEKNHEFKELHEEVNNLRLVIDSIQTKKKRKRLLGVF
ncbi:DNA-binding protein, partial [Clostridium perfringens]